MKKKRFKSGNGTLSFSPEVWERAREAIRKEDESIQRDIDEIIGDKCQENDAKSTPSTTNVTMEIRLSSKGQIVIPKELRDKLSLTPQKPLKIYEQDGKIIIETIPDQDDDPWDWMEILDFQGKNDDEVIGEAMGELGKEVSHTENDE